MRLDVPEVRCEFVIRGDAQYERPCLLFWLYNHFAVVKWLYNHSGPLSLQNGRTVWNRHPRGH